DDRAAVQAVERDARQEDVSRHDAERLVDTIDHRRLRRQPVDHRCAHLFWRFDAVAALDRHSHSMVAGGFDDTSYTTRFTSGISFTMRADTRAITSYGMRAQSAVMKSSVVTARSATSEPYVR